MNPKIISKETDLIKEVFDHIDLSDDLSEYLIVFPGKRPAHFLKKYISKALKKPYLSPLIFSSDEFVDFLFKERLGNTCLNLESFDAVSILYDMQTDMPDSSIRKNFFSLDMFYSIGLKIFKEVEELYIECIDPGRVKDIDLYNEEKIFKTEESLKSLFYFYEGFYETVLNIGRTTRSHKYRVVSENVSKIDFSPFKKIIIAGFFALTRSEEMIFKEFLKNPDFFIIFQDGPFIGKTLKTLDIDKSYKYNVSDFTKKNITFYKSPDSHGQILALNKLIDEEKESFELKDGLFFSEETVFVLPSSDTLFPLVNHTLAYIGTDEYNISLGYPLFRTPIYSYFKLIFDLSQSGDEAGNEFRVYLPDYINFILHPYTKNIFIKDSSNISRIIFHALEEALLSERLKSFLSLSDIEGDSFIVDFVFDKVSKCGECVTKDEIISHIKYVHNNTIKRFISFNSIADFLDKASLVLNFIYSESTAKIHPLFFPFSESFLKSFLNVSKSLLKDRSFNEKSSYFSFFKNYISTCKCPFEGTPLRGLQVLGFLETRNITFKNVFILDLNEDVMPAVSKDDSLIPVKIRLSLGLPIYSDREKLYEYYFDNLLSKAKEVNIFYVENDTKEKSRFVEKLLWRLQKVSSTLKDEKFIKNIQYSVNLKVKKPVPINKNDKVISFLKSFSYSATSLNAYLVCPLKFYYRYVLNLGEKNSVSKNIEKADIGTFVHDNILKKYFENKVGFELSLSDLSIGEMERLVDIEFKNKYGDDISGNIYLMYLQVKKRMVEFLKNYQLPLLRSSNLKILSVEERISKQFEGYKIYGLLDRVEKRDGKIVIIDYKVSANHTYLDINFKKLDIEKRESLSKSIGSLQLPFYMLLYAEDEKDVSNIDAMFLLLGQSSINMSIEVPFCKKTDEYKENFKIMKQVIKNLLLEITDKQCPFTATVNTKKVCVLCDFKGHCGV